MIWSLFAHGCHSLFTCSIWNWSEVWNVQACLAVLIEIEIVRQIYEPNSEDRKSRLIDVTVMWFFCKPMHDLYERNSEDRKSQSVWFKGDT